MDSDTTWNHFEHFRLPEAVYTDALSLFGPSSSGDQSDPKSEFQRALRALGVAHLVAPTPQAKGKIERRFGTFQERLVTLLDLHFSLRSIRRVNNDHTIDFDGQNFEISAALLSPPKVLRKSVTLLHHPHLRFWVLEHPPKDVWPPVLAAFSL